jgi:hypothetical protein
MEHTLFIKNEMENFCKGQKISGWEKIKLEVHIQTAAKKLYEYNYRIIYNMNKFDTCNRSW